jgi:hypothetical protein
MDIQPLDRLSNSWSMEMGDEEPIRDDPDADLVVG